MGVYHYKCNKCQTSIRKILAKAEIVYCETCKSKLKRDPKPLTTKQNEVLDNGIQTKAVERMVDAEEIYKERSRMDSEANAEYNKVGVER